MTRPKANRCCAVHKNIPVTGELVRLVLRWPGPPPEPGQFFMVKALRSSVFLPRAISVESFFYEKTKQKENPVLSFLIARKGKGTEELASLKPEELIELTGPLGNSWYDFMPSSTDKPVALVGGGAGIAPLTALAMDGFPARKNKYFHYYAGFRSSTREELERLLGPAALNVIIACIAFEAKKPAAPLWGARLCKGRVPDFLKSAAYSAVFACGPEPMLAAVAERCGAAGVPCYVSLERRMACGTGACLGCTVRGRGGNKRCCADGPIFPAEEIFFG
ncbi:MAG: dihydroorotate dehydrogenase electron transfer subunit [Treponema sp.]|jgi:NAD(P)H-flavin reductase|nr:dihydroorotate dehydrogenase electron transfer subunit [Treponema sp.]